MEDCLAFRQQLKEEFRARLRKETGGIEKAARCSTTDQKYMRGFFGPSETVFSDRVVQQIQSCLRIPNESPPAAVSNTAREMSDTVERPSRKNKWPKETRDYSFLSSDCRHEISGNNKTQVSRPPVEMIKKEISNGSKIQGAKAVSQTSRPVEKVIKGKGSKTQAIKRVSQTSSRAKEMIIMEKGSKIQAIKRVSQTSSRPEEMIIKEKGSKIQAIKRVSQTSSRPKEMIINEKGSNIQAIKRISQTSRPEKKIERVSKNYSSKKALEPGRKTSPCLKRKLEQAEEEIDAVSLIRKMFGYDPTKFCNEDDEEDANMEATFDDIQKEERRSTKIAKKEDDEELKNNIMGTKLKRKSSSSGTSG